jgi:polyphenol oxidase
MQPFNPLEKFSVEAVVSAFSRASDGNMSFSFGDTRQTLENREIFLGQLGIDYRDLITAKQVHGKNVEPVTIKDKRRGALNYESSLPDTDGFITQDPGVPIAILTADCLSVFIYDPIHRAIAILHAGWRSTEQNIAQAGVLGMQNKFGSLPKDLLVGFGPSIRSCCFEVEKGFKSNFPFGLAQRAEKLYMDISLINRQQLVDSGVRQENIFDPGYCTFSDDDFFSFRKEGKLAGRMVSVIMLK